MNLSFQQSGNSGVLTITGEMGIEYASELKSSLAEALSAVTRLEVDLAGVTAASVCSLQLFCSAHRAAAKSGGTLRFSNVGEAFMKSAGDAGFPRHTGCRDHAKADCLWCEPGEGRCP